MSPLEVWRRLAAGDGTWVVIGDTRELQWSLL